MASIAHLICSCSNHVSRLSGGGSGRGSMFHGTAGCFALAFGGCCRVEAKKKLHAWSRPRATSSDQTLPPPINQLLKLAIPEMSPPAPNPIIDHPDYASSSCSSSSSSRSSSPHPTYHTRARGLSINLSNPPTSTVDTVYYGWILLIATWLVFVVGVGSVTGVWEWAWGGEERSWPQSIQVEDGVPIPGYYPAMVILGGVLAWVWVILAWVGLKYFKHARVRD